MIINQKITKLKEEPGATQTGMFSVRGPPLASLDGIFCVCIVPSPLPSHRAHF